MGNAESSHGTSFGMMLVALVAAPFSGGASLALAGASMGTATVATVQAVSGITADADGKDSIKEWAGGIGSGVHRGISKIM